MLKNPLLLLALLFSLSCFAQNSRNEKLDPEEFEKQIAAGNAILLDVRTAAEYRAGHIPAALQADWNNKKEFEERVRYIDKSSVVYIYCAIEPRSTAAAMWMRNNGFNRVLELNGGFIGWKKKGKPTEEEAAVTQMTMEEYRSLLPPAGIVLVDFGAGWCPPCVKMEPVIKEIEKTLKNKFTLVKIEAGIHTDIQQILGIDSYPTFIIYKEGKEIWRQEGLVEKSVLLSQLGK